MRSLMILGLFVSTSFAAPVPLPSRSINKPVFEAKSSTEAASTIARLASPAFLERVLRSSPALAVKLPAGSSVEQRRQWIADHLKVEAAGTNRVRVNINSKDSEEARILREAVVKILTSPMTPAERATLMAMQNEHSAMSMKMNRLRAIRGGVAIGRRVIIEDVNPETSKMLQSIQAELAAQPLRKVG